MFSLHCKKKKYFEQQNFFWINLESTGLIFIRALWNISNDKRKVAMKCQIASYKTNRNIPGVSQDAYWYLCENYSSNIRLFKSNVHLKYWPAGFPERSEFSNTEPQLIQDWSKTFVLSKQHPRVNISPNNDFCTNLCILNQHI